MRMIFIADSCSFAVQDARLFGNLSQQRHRARPPNGAGELTLMTCTAPGDPPWSDLPPLRYEVRQPANILVIDELDLVHAELTNLAPAEPAPLDWLARWRNLSILLW